MTQKKKIQCCACGWYWGAKIGRTVTFDLCSFNFQSLQARSGRSWRCSGTVRRGSAARLSSPSGRRCGRRSHRWAFARHAASRGPWPAGHASQACYARSGSGCGCRPAQSESEPRRPWGTQYNSLISCISDHTGLYYGLVVLVSVP